MMLSRLRPRKRTDGDARITTFHTFECWSVDQFCRVERRLYCHALREVLSRIDEGKRLIGVDDFLEHGCVSQM